MKYKIIIALTVLLGFQPILRADEGMWLPIFIERLNYIDMKKMGLQLTPEEIYSVNHASIKDAIAIFGRGCTSEIVSDKGLLITNHHCGYGSIQAHSSVEHDYLTNGFWAESLADELPNPNLTATFLVRIEDVSSAMLEVVNDTMSEEERAIAIRKKGKEIADKAKEENDFYSARVRRFFEGNEYYLFVYKVYKDVRLVGAPPSSIGKYGADTDNWMWPRHTGDFSIFRVYADADGNPAEYAEDNIPLKPKYHLPISADGVKEGDFTMIMGYPGSTERYMTSYGVKMALDISNQSVVEVRDVKLKIMMEDMQNDPAIRIKYASKYARTSNYWKYYIGQSKGLKRLKVYDKKRALEQEFSQWVNQTEHRKVKYGSVLEDFSKAYKTISSYEKSRIYMREAGSRGSEILSFAGRFGRLEKELQQKTPDQNKIDELKAGILSRMEDYFKNYNAPTDEKLLAAMLTMYHNNISADQQPEYLKDIAKKYKGDFKAYARKVFATSYFVSPERVNELLENPSAKKINKDPAFHLSTEFNNFYYDQIRPKTEQAYNELDRASRLFIAGLREMQPDKKFYPDANFTMRLTYGQVKDYFPADAVHYNYFTTLKGVMEKEDPNNWEFVVPEKLKELYRTKDYGPYGDHGVMKVCFLSTNDITGGNSGSGILNARGELIGLAFDGNWEAMSGDIVFEPELQRTINVDIRYVLFIIDKYAGAKRLIDEMDIVSHPPALEVNPNTDRAEEMEPVRN